MNPQGRAFTVLFVDDDAGYVETLRELFELWTGSGWQTEGATSSAEALALIDRTPVDLVVIDLQMPVVDGLQMARMLSRKKPDLPKAILTGRNDAEARQACLDAGVDLFLTKPASPDALNEVFANLRQLVDTGVRDGFSGMVRIGLPEVIQLECLGNKSSVLEVVAGAERAMIFIRNGRIVHAQIGDLGGLDAFNRILTLNSGQFGLKAFAEPPSETIHGSWEILLMDAVRLRDEATQGGGPATDESPRPSHPAVPDAPTDSSHPAVAVCMAAEPRPRTRELLLCNANDQPVLDWECSDTREHARVIRLLKEAAQRLGSHAPVGSLRAVEFAGDRERVVYRVTNEWTMVVHTNHPPGETPA